MDRSNETLGKRNHRREGVWVLFFLLMVAIAIPTIYGLWVSFVDYSPAMGRTNSPWVGLQNYQKFLQSPYGMPVMRNSLTLSALGFAGSLVLGMLSAWFVSRIRGTKGRRVALATLLLPAFVPSICWALAALQWLPVDMLVTPEKYPWAYLCMTILPGAGLIGFVGAGMARRPNGLWKGIGLASLLWLFLCLTPDYETLQWTYNPMVYQTADTLDTYAYRIGLIQANYGASGATYGIKLLAQCLLGALVCVPVFLVMNARRKALGENVRTLEDGAAEWRRLPSLAWCVPVLLLWVTGLVLFFLPGLRQGNLLQTSLIWNSLPMQLLCTLLAFCVAWLIGWVLIEGLRRCHWVVFLLSAMLLLAARNPVIGAYLFFRELGMINTMYPIVLSSLFTPTGMLLVFFTARIAAERSPRARSASLALLPACYAAVQAWGGASTQIRYLMSREWTPLGVLLREVGLHGEGVAAQPLLTALVLLPALLLGFLGALAALRTLED